MSNTNEALYLSFFKQLNAYQRLMFFKDTNSIPNEINYLLPHAHERLVLNRMVEDGKISLIENIVKEAKDRIACP